MSYEKRLYEQAEQELERRRLSAESRLDFNIAEAERKIPEIAEIRRQLARTSIELSKLIIRRDGDFRGNFEKIKNQNLQGQAMIKRLLKQGGFPEDYLEARYSCQICNDRGYIGGDRCVCYKELLNRLAVDKLNSEANMPKCDFEHFSLAYYEGKQENGVNCRQKMEDNLKFCIDYADSFSRNSASLFLLGKTGVGKTHISLAIAKRVTERGYTAAYGSLLNYLRLVEKEHFGRSEDTESDTMQTLINADLLVLDDLGSEFRSNFYESALYNIINSRINLGLPTIISSNLTTAELQKNYNDRIISRIFGTFTTLLFVGEDVRQIKRLRNEA
ncbi:MAG: ATP-binding protein [Ruminococcus sp.]|nr:ATP-binding protein [Ruminococcus sp.]MCM1380909.1 ATP-binding protein [Muribaculaceae bacterium]MCM1479048.1 ATP-binding protein [Muribaculaceae bacterium]